jgi:hypothetical protein
MVYAKPGHGGPDPFGPLVTAFGDRLRVWRDEDRVEWSLDGHVVAVEVDPAGRVAAQFIAPESTELVSGRPSSAVYARDRSGYPLTDAGCSRMVDDMIAFFSGAREPHFTFVAVR